MPDTLIEPDLFTRSRTGDPVTSREAVESIAHKITSTQQEILDWARQQPNGFIDLALVAHLGGKAHSSSSLRTRRSELVDSGWIRHREIDGIKQYRKVGQSNRRHIVWEAVL